MNYICELSRKAEFGKKTIVFTLSLLFMLMVIPVKATYAYQDANAKIIKFEDKGHCKHIPSPSSQCLINFLKVTGTNQYGHGNVTWRSWDHGELYDWSPVTINSPSYGVYDGYWWWHSGTWVTLKFQLGGWEDDRYGGWRSCDVEIPQYGYLDANTILARYRGHGVCDTYWTWT